MIICSIIYIIQESWQKHMRMSLALEELLVIMDGAGKQQAVAMTDVKCLPHRSEDRQSFRFMADSAAVADRYGGACCGRLMQGKALIRMAQLRCKTHTSQGGQKSEHFKRRSPATAEIGWRP
jgi:hypothetical protein